MIVEIIEHAPAILLGVIGAVIAWWRLSPRQNTSRLEELRNQLDNATTTAERFDKGVGLYMVTAQEALIENSEAIDPDPASVLPQRANRVWHFGAELKERLQTMADHHRLPKRFDKRLDKLIQALLPVQSYFDALYRPEAWDSFPELIPDGVTLEDINRERDEAVANILAAMRALEKEVAACSDFIHEHVQDLRKKVRTAESKIA
ncbi:MAG: hypothetical protein AAF608_05125 [Pseudomonadota bacterium]